MKQLYNRWIISLIGAFQIICTVQAAALLSLAERQEIQSRWQLIFDRQLDDIEQDVMFVADDEERRDILWILQRCAIWSDRLMHFDDYDIQQAMYMMHMVEDGRLWQEFLATRNQEAIVAYIHQIMYVLGKMISPECTVTFPIVLLNLDEQLELSGLSEDIFTTHVRRAFLAFTFVVSKMSAIIQGSATM